MPGVVLRVEQRLHTALHYEGHIAGLYMGAVVDIDGHLQVGIKFLEHHACYLHACQYALLFDDEALAAHLVGRNG